MSNRYKTAALIGASLGLYAMICTALSPAGVGGGPVLDAIPSWNHRFYGVGDTSSNTLGLEVQALILRFCWLFFEDGFSYLFPCVAVALGYAKISELRENSPWLGVIVKSLKLAWLILALGFVLLIPFLTSGPLFMQVVHAFLQLPCSIVVALKSGIFLIVWSISLGIHSLLFLCERREYDQATL